MAAIDNLGSAKLSPRNEVRRLLAWDWRDGPTEGLVQLEQTDGAYFFRLLEERHSDDDEDIRVFGLYPCSIEEFDRLTAELSVDLEPRWPIWWRVWQFADEAAKARADRLVESIKTHAGPLNLVVVTASSFQSPRAIPLVESPAA